MADLPGNKDTSGKRKSGAYEIYIGRRQLAENLRAGLQTFFQSDAHFYGAFLLALFIAGTAIFIRSGGLSVEKLHEERIAPRNIYSPVDIVVEDVSATAAKRKKAHDAVRDIYALDPKPSAEVAERVRKAFDLMRDGYLRGAPKPYRFVMKEMDDREVLDPGLAGDENARRRQTEYGELRKFEATPAFAALERRFYETLDVDVPAQTREVLRAHHYRPRISDWLGAVLAEAMQTGVVPQKDLMPPSSKAGVSTINSESGQALLSMEYREVADLRGAQDFIRRRLGEMLAAQPLSLQKGVEGVALSLARPNLSFDRMRTQDLRGRESAATPPVLHRMQKGELIVREGERMTSEHLAKIKAVQSGLKQDGSAQSVAGTIIFLLLALLACAYYIKTYMPEFAADRANVVLLGVLFIGQGLALRLFHAGAEVFSAANPATMLSSYLYAAPYALAALLAAMFFGREAAVLVAMLSAVSASVLYPPMHHYTTFALAGGVVAVFHAGRIKRRSEVWKAGVRLASVSVGVIVMTEMLGGTLFTRECFDNVLFAILGAVITAALVQAFQPLVEAAFPVVSDIKLLELQDLNHPLLARMAVSAPGTYHHSIVVGNLAEDAAEVIGANPLLARVGAYFHDIGKMHKPEYFIENQRDGVNKHDSLTPYMSALVLTAHVTKGLEMAREYRLIPQVRDIIAEHHGTQVIQYFYHRAREQEKAAGGQVSEQVFRYPGRKPKSREAAIVALADSVEAASRALKAPTSSRLEQLVSRVINDKFVSGQLDDSHLTLHDLNKIGDSFVRILHGIFHYRVEYPADKDENKTDSGVAEGNKGPGPAKAEEKAPPNLRVIG